MNKYIIVYMGRSSFYNDYTSETVEDKELCNYEVEALSKEEAYNKFKEYAEKEKEEAKSNRYYKNFRRSFTILNIIDLKG